MFNPGKSHLRAFRWISKYLKATLNISLLFKKNASDVSIINKYIDSDFVGYKNKRRLLSSYIFIVFGNTLSWKANIQFVALSTIEIEFITCTEAMKVGLWFRGFTRQVLLMVILLILGQNM